MTRTISAKVDRISLHHKIGTLLLSSLLVLICNCGDERFVTVGQAPTAFDDDACNADSDCKTESGEICVFGACAPIGNFACETTQAPLAHIDPIDVDFGEVVIGESAGQMVTIANAGECNLTIYGASLADTSTRGFDCSPCDLTHYPQVIAPNHSATIDVNYSPLAIGPAVGTLLVSTDDRTAGPNGIINVNLGAAYSGVPALVLDPTEINFGFVPYDGSSASSSRTETIRISNQGTGNAALVLQFIYVVPGGDFSIPDDFAAVVPEHPIILAPFDENNPDTWIDVPVTFKPTRFANQSTMFTVSARAGNTDEVVNVSARLSGSSLGPARISVNPSEVTFRADSGEPLSMGMSAFRQVVISNTGQSELTIDLAIDDTSQDFTISPSHLAPIPPGGNASVGVYYTPSASSDPGRPYEPRRSIDAYLRVISNDAEHVLTTVLLHGWAREGSLDDILRLEMTFDNSSSSWASNDYRDVDLELTSPLGFSCRKPMVQYAPGPNGTFIVASVQDFCANWTNSNLQGRAMWIPGGLFEEPERVTLFQLGNTTANNQEFTARVYYMQDCSNIPSGILADLLGIGTSAILGALGASVGVPLAVDPSAVRNLIANNCWEHSGTRATVHIFINNREVAAPQVSLSRKGDYRDVAQIRRLNGAFHLVEQ